MWTSPLEAGKDLRIVEHRQNCQNRHEVKTSRFPGVHWEKAYSKWAAAASVNKKIIHLGRFENEIDAFKAYAKAAETHGFKILPEYELMLEQLR